MERGERDGDLGADALAGFEADLRMVLFADFTHDGKAEPGAAGGLGAAFIDAIEPLKDARLMRLGNADARVAHGQHMVVHTHRNGSVVAVVADRIVNEVVDQLRKQRTVAGDDRRFAGKADRRIVAQRGGFERFDILLREHKEVDLLGLLHDLRFIKLGQLDDVGDEL